MRLAPGDHFDRYVIASLLGRGGMGEVYRAQDTRLQRAVALKILRLEEAPAGTDGKLSTDGAARLLREARAVAAMDHPNAVAIFDVGEHEGVAYLAMEFIAGKTLRQCVGDPSVPLERRIRWIVDIARALGAAHRRGLVHRDVKPENVMIREDGVVKVLDFGIARSVSAPVDPTGATEASALETLTEKGIVVGTPLYMAPEHLRGERIDGRADQFSWAVVAYELLSGSTPWKAASSSLQLLAQILSMEPVSLRVAQPDLPADVDEAITRALSKSPGARFETIEEAAARLEPYAGASIELATPLLSARPSARPSLASTRTQLAAPSPAEGERRNERRWRRPALVATGLAVITGVAMAALGRESRVAEGVADAGAPPAPTAVTAGLAWTDTGSQASPNGEAEGAYTAGMQGVRDGSVRHARALFEHATRADPSFAAAHLRAALLADARDAALRTHVQKATQLRLILSPHDRALLDAIEPWTHVPTDFAESKKRLEALVAKDHDADAGFLLALTRERTHDYDGAIAASDDVRARDPAFAAALRVKGRAEMKKGDVAAASATYDECMRVAPGATWCIEDNLDFAARAGRCDATEQLARRLIAIDPQSPRGYQRLASALAAREQPVEAVRMALEQAWQRTDEAHRKVAKIAGETTLDLLAGDLRRATDHAAQWEPEIAESPDDYEHAALARLRMRLALEAGDKSGAAKIADDYSKRRAAWTVDDWEEDPSIFVLGSAYRASAITREAMESERSAWLAHDRERVQGVGQTTSRARAWVLAYAAMAVTAGDAKEALTALPGYLPLPAAPLRDDESDDAIGETYRLAGDGSEGRAYLEEGAASCGVFDDPIAHRHALLHAGIVRAAAGDEAGACAAFAKVVSAWSAGKGRSVTLDAARAEARAAKCGPG